MTRSQLYNTNNTNRGQTTGMVTYITWLAHLWLRPVFLNRRAAAWYRALASIIPGHERFSWNLSF